LHLSECPQELVVFTANQSFVVGKSTVGVRCDGATKPWKIYIPVQVNIFKSVLVSTRPLQRGQQLDSGDFKPVRTKLTSANQIYFSHPKNILGKILKYPLGPGKPFSARLLSYPKLVKRGQEVILMATSASMKVRMSGKALADGAKGDLIQVRNIKTRRVVEGIVTAAGLVQVNM
jgi:flagella basal body P-ring formation protein FlgA